MSAKGSQAGQAAVEAALTLPLTVFLVLGLLQLFMLLQARILAQYAVGRAAKMGAVNHANCHAMTKASVMVLIPAIDASWARGPGKGARYAAAVAAHLPNRYRGAADGDRTGPLVWLDRVRPLASTIQADTEEETWNLPPPEGLDRTLELRMVFWAPLKIPFANWVFARMALAAWGLDAFHGVDPLMSARRDASWVAESPPPPARIGTELQLRYDAHEYVFPVVVSYATHMMSPPRFSVQNCPP